MEFTGFDWDRGNLAKCRKHGVPVETIENLFHHGLMILPPPPAAQAPPPANSRGRKEVRDGEVLIRPISARTMHKEESDHYAESY